MEKSEKFKKVAVITAIIGIMAVIVWLIWLMFGDFFMELFTLLQHGSQEEMMAYLNSQNELRGLLSIFVISVLQVVSIFFPGMVIQLAAGIIYGWWKSFFVCYAGFVFGNTLVFFIARKFRRFFEQFYTPAKKSWVTEKINSTKPEFIFALACMIPGIPNGFIPYFAARTEIKGIHFSEAVAVSSWIQIILNCIAGHFLIRGQYTYMILSIILQIVLILVCVWKRDWFLGKGSRAAQD